MVAKRILTTLMLNNGVLFRSKKFRPDYRYTLNFVDMWSIDELILLDISRNVSFDSEEKQLFFNEMKKISKNAYVPITVGGGIRKLEDIEKLLKNGADKVILNSASALVATGNAQNLKEGALKSIDSLDNGKAMEKLDKLVEMTNM